MNAYRSFLFPGLLIAVLMWAQISAAQTDTTYLTCLADTTSPSETQAQTIVDQFLADCGGTDSSLALVRTEPAGAGFNLIYAGWNCAGVLDTAHTLWVAVCTGPFPVEMSYFEADPSGSNVTLRWETFSESQNMGFQPRLRRSNEEIWVSNIDWYQYGALNSETTRSYTASISGLSPGRYHAQLVQYDQNQSPNLSSIIEFTIDGTQGLEAWPNPLGQDRMLNLETPTWASQIQLVSLQGQVVLTRKIAVLDGGPLNVSSLPAGLYLLRAIGSGQAETKRVVIQP